jgi:hypothetical protein
MATYNQIYNLKVSGSLLNRTAVACMKTADYILTTEAGGATNHANRVIWAKAALLDPESKAKQLMWAVLSNGDVQSQGEEVADATIQYIVDVKLDLFATGS